MKNGKKFLISVLPLLLGFGFLSCDNGTPSSFDRSNILIGIAMPGMHADRWEKDGTALMDEALALGYRAELAYGGTDQATQNDQIREFMEHGASLIIVANIDTSIKPVVKEAKDSGVIIIAYDRLIQQTADYEYYITFNSYKIGEMQGQSIVNALKLDSAGQSEPKYIALFTGSPSDKNAELLFSGAKYVLDPYITSDKLVVTDGQTNFSSVYIQQWEPANVQDRIEKLFDGQYTVDAVLAPNDKNARYIIDYIVDNSSMPIPIVTGQDAEFESAMYIKESKQYMTIFKDARALAANAIKLADQLLTGKTINMHGAIKASGVLAKMGDTGVKVVTSFLVEPKLLVTKDNLNELINAGWFSDAEEKELRE